jgi:hypothetical protein
MKQFLFIIILAFNNKIINTLDINKSKKDRECKYIYDLLELNSSCINLRYQNFYNKHYDLITKKKDIYCYYLRNCCGIINGYQEKYNILIIFLLLFLPFIILYNT